MASDTRVSRRQAMVASTLAAAAAAAADYAMMAAQCDTYEVQAARDALAQSQNPHIRSFAQEVIQDHIRSSDALHQAVAASGLPLTSPAMSSDQGMWLSSLQSLRGAPFDQAYARQRVLAHRQALAVRQSYSEGGKDANLRKVASSSVPMIQHHLNVAIEIMSEVGGY